MGIHNIEVKVAVQVAHGGGVPVMLYGIQELGFNASGGFIISGWRLRKDQSEPGQRGGYMTSLPISPVAYRREHGPGSQYPVHSGYVLHDDHLTVFDDWGQEHRIIAPPDILSVLVRDCETHELPNLKKP